MLNKNDLGNLYSLIERVNVSGKEVEEVYRLKLKIIGILQEISKQKQNATSIPMGNIAGETLNTGNGTPIVEDPIVETEPESREPAPTTPAMKSEDEEIKTA